MLIFTLAVKSNSQFAAALAEVRKHSDVRYGMLRVGSGETSGRIFIVDGAFIIGCELSDGRKGPIALTTLISMERAIIGFLEMPRRTGGGGVAVNIESLLNDCTADENENVGNVLRRVLNIAPVQFGNVNADAVKQPAPHSLMMHVIHNQVRKELGPQRDATSSGAAATLTEIVLRNLDTYNKLLQRLDRAPDKTFISRSELLCADIAMFESLLESSHRNTYAAQSVKRLRQTLLRIIKRARAQPSDYEPAVAQTQSTAQPKPLAPAPGEEESISPHGLFNNLASTLQHDISALPDSEAEHQRQEAAHLEEAEAAAALSGSQSESESESMSESMSISTATGQIRVFSTETDFGEDGLTGGGGFGTGLYNSDQWQFGSDDPFDWGESLFLTEDEQDAPAEVEESEAAEHSYALESEPVVQSDNGDAGRAANAISAAAAMSAVPPSPSFNAPPVGASPPPPAPQPAAVEAPQAPPAETTSSISGSHNKITEIPENLRYPHAGLSGGLAHEHDAAKDKVTDSNFRRDLKQTDQIAKKRVEKHAKSLESRSFVVGIGILIAIGVGGFLAYQSFLAPPSATQLYKRALSSEQQKYYTRALEEVDRSIELEPSFVPAYLLRARVRMNNSEFGEALKDYNQAIKLGSTDDEALKGRAEAAFKADNWLESQEALEKLLVQSPEDPEIHHKLATTYMRLNKSNQAVEHYTHAITGGAPDLGPIYRNRGMAYEALKDDQKAAADYSEAIKLNAADSAALGRRGALFLKTGNLEAALSDLSKAAEKTPSAEALLDLASIYARKGDHVKTADLATRALDLNKKNARALVARANSYLAQKAFPRSIADFDEALLLEPNNASVRSQRDKAMAAYRAASPSAVQDMAADAPKKLPPIPKNMPESSLIFQGYEQLRNGHADVAIQMFTEALNKEPSNETARRYLAHALFRGRHPKEAAEQFKSVASTSELSETDQIVYGDALAASNQADAAIDVLKNVVAIKPTSVAGRVALARVYQKSGNKEKAQQVVNEGLQLTSDPAEKRELNSVLSAISGAAPPTTTPKAGNNNDGNSWPEPAQQQR